MKANHLTQKDINLIEEVSKVSEGHGSVCPLCGEETTDGYGQVTIEGDYAVQDVSCPNDDCGLRWAEYYKADGIQILNRNEIDTTGLVCETCDSPAIKEGWMNLRTGWTRSTILEDEKGYRTVCVDCRDEYRCSIMDDVRGMN